MGVLTAEEILAKLRERPTKRLSVPALGGEVILRKLTGGDLGAIDTWVSAERDKDPTGWRGRLRAKVIALSLVDEKGSPLFDEDDVAELLEGAAGPLDELYDECRYYSGVLLGPGERKNLLTIQGESSASA